MEDKKLVWLPDSEADKYEKAIDESSQIKVIDEIIARGKKDLRDGVEMMSEDEAMLKGMLLRYKKMYTETLNEHSEAVYKIWEDLDKALPTLKTQTTKLKNRLQPILNSVNEIYNQFDLISKKIESVNTYQFTKMIELIDAIQHCDDTTKQVLIQVLNK